MTTWTVDAEGLRIVHLEPGGVVAGNRARA
jgi:hypothetical protein